MDLGPAFAKAFREKAPNAQICLDPFHVVKVRHEAPCIPAVMKGHRLLGCRSIPAKLRAV
ncbi:transposase [Ferrimicrobium acidiphilum DSM 19497]|uniref:Transposase n=2 Tax=Ferrimicrobium acidiphilum TaxID=121039 RepID=A0A0D8FTA9_9ACTN|nr:transposase [Ferrimicrobium acidiphilum DSM 19497]